MKETEKRGLVACKPCGRICIAAFTLALLSFLPSCTNGTEEDSPAQDTLAYQRPAQNPTGAEVILPPGGTGTADADKPAETGPEGEAATRAEATEVTDPKEASESPEQADAPEETAATGGTDSPAQEEYPDGTGIHTLEQAETGDIVLASGEILTPGYLASRTDGGLEPVGIICPGDSGRNMLVVLDAFYEEKEERGWGNVSGKKYKLEELSVTMRRGAPQTKELGASPTKANGKENSIGNEKIIRKQTQNGWTASYIWDCEEKFACAIGNLQWELPTVFEVKAIYENRSALQKSKAAIAQYFRNTGDERAAQLEGPALISRKKHILTSNSGYGNWSDKGVPGFWAFREADDGFSEVNKGRFVCIIDMNSDPVYIYSFTVKDKASGDISPIEVVLSRGSRTGFAAMAVAYLK